MKSSTSCKVYFSLLALCYLEVVLWTSCLFSPAAALSGTSDSHSYLLRETGNLKYAGREELHFNLPVLLRLHVDAEQLRLEHFYVAATLQQRLADASPAILQPALADLRIPLTDKGLPAPYTGIAAID